jgi:DNA-binding response OmpR family regulator
MQEINDILIVEDDPPTGEFLVEALQEEGYPCCVAYDGESALLAIETARPALVLLDLHLPDLSGVDILAQLHRHDQGHVPIVLITADGAAAAELPTTTFPEYLLKPFDLDTLLLCVGRYVRPQQRHARLLTARLTPHTDSEAR